MASAPETIYSIAVGRELSLAVPVPGAKRGAVVTAYIADRRSLFASPLRTSAGVALSRTLRITQEGTALVAFGADVLADALASLPAGVAYIVVEVPRVTRATYRLEIDRSGKGH